MRSLLLTLPIALLTFSNTATANDTLVAGVVDGADMFFYLDAAQFQNSSIMEKIEAMAPATESATKEEMMAKMEAATGLTEDDMGAVALSMDIDNVDFETMQTNPDQLVNIPAIMTIGLKKSISPEQLMAGIQLVAAENGPGSVSMTSETRDGVDLIAIRPTTPTDGGPQEFLAALSPNGQTIMVSMNAASLASASQRLAAGKMAAPSEAMRGALQALKKSPFRMAFIFPAFLKDQMSANLAADPMMGTLAGMQAISVDANADTALQVNLRLDMGSPDAASNAMGTIQGMMAMMPMMLGSMPPQVAATAQKIKVANDGNYVHIQARVDEKDLEGLGQPVDGM